MARSRPPVSGPPRPTIDPWSPSPLAGVARAQEGDSCERSNRPLGEEFDLRAAELALDPCLHAVAGDVAGLRRHLDRGGAPDVRCDEGWSLLELAAAHGRAAAVELLLAAGARAESLHVAVAGGDAGVVSALIAAGVPVDRRDGAGLTPLHQAICQGDRAIVTALVRAGADLGAEVGDTGPVALARRVGDAHLVGLLRQRGARR